MIHVFINRLKILLRNRTMIFWTLLFPIILGTFFNLAFSNLDSSENFKTFKIGIINDQNYKDDTSFKQVINVLSKSDDKIFDVNFYKDEKQAKEKLKNNKIEGYYVIKDKINVVVSRNDFNQTIMKSIVDDYYQKISVINNIYEFDATKFSENLIEKLNTENNYFEEQKQNNTDFSVIYFYTLVGMVCMYGSMFGNNSINDIQPNLSKKGARFCMSPTHKLKSLIGSLMAGFVIQYMFLIILILYLIFVLKIDFANQAPLILLLSFFGVLAGITFGMFVGSCSKKNENVKTGILISVTMIFCFLSGMMLADMKYIIQNNIPILAKINPVNLITDGLYSLYYYSDLTRYYSNIFYLLIFSFVMIILSYFFLRRKKYDSI